MKKLSEFVNEASQAEKVYVVKDDEGAILHVFDLEEDAKKYADEFNKETNNIGKASVEAGNKSDFVKE